MGTTILFGGTFDPVHHGHLITAQAARETLRADICLLMPARTSPHKVANSLDTDISAAHRLAMLHLAVAGSPEMAVDPLELHRPAPSYTFDTVAELLRRQPGQRIVLLIGSDQLPRFHTWHRITELLNQVDIAILERPGAPLPAGLEQISAHLGPVIVQRLSAAVLPVPRIDLSATDIRRRAAAGLSLRYLVPDAVATYIKEKQLYRAPSAEM